ncbi:hypothetical protein PtB15_6B60 [Puccinia triticina]|nr:hypothetical protein PtB15_6B60 [Puccinia triticina]
MFEFCLIVECPTQSFDTAASRTVKHRLLQSLVAHLRPLPAVRGSSLRLVLHPARPPQLLPNMSVLRLLFLLLATLLAAVSAFGQELCAGCNSMVPGAPVGEQVQCLARIMCRQGGVDHGICTAWYYPLVVYHCPRCTIVIREKERYACGPAHFAACQCPEPDEPPRPRVRSLSRLLSTGSSSKSKVHPQ